jgi:hypothetical protein
VQWSVRTGPTVGLFSASWLQGENVVQMMVGDAQGLGTPTAVVADKTGRVEHPRRCDDRRIGKVNAKLATDQSGFNGNHDVKGYDRERREPQDGSPQQGTLSMNMTVGAITPHPA